MLCRPSKIHMTSVSLFVIYDLHVGTQPWAQHMALKQDHTFSFRMHLSLEAAAPGTVFTSFSCYSLDRDAHTKALVLRDWLSG